MKHIKSVDGISGCYRGLTPKIIGSIVSVIGSKKVADKLQLDEPDANDSKDSDELTEDEKSVPLSFYDQFIFSVTYELASFLS